MVEHRLKKKESNNMKLTCPMQTQRKRAQHLPYSIGVVLEWTSRWIVYHIIHKGGQALSVIVDVT